MNILQCSGYGRAMDRDDYEPNPFSSESLWRLSRFSIEVLQPLESLPWNADLPGMFVTLRVGIITLSIVV